MDKNRVLEKILFIIGMALDVIMLAIMMTVIISYIEAPHLFNKDGTNDLLLMMALFICGVFLLAIDIAGLKRVYNDKKKVIFSTFLMKATVWSMSISVGFVAFMQSGEDIIPVIFGLVVAVIFTILAITFGKSTSAKKADSNQNNGFALKIQHFTADKAKWAWDDASMEYADRFQVIRQNLSDEESNKVYEYASMPITYFLTWLIMNDHIDKSFAEELGAEYIQNFKARKESPVDLVTNIDNALTMDEIDDELQEFMDRYYEMEITSNRYYTASTKRYYVDYYTAIRNPNRFFYVVDFSWDIYDKIAASIDEAYEYYRRDVIFYDDDYNNNVDLPGTARCDALNCDLELIKVEDVTEAYLKKCVEHVGNWSETFIDRLCDELINYSAFNDVPDDPRDELKKVAITDMVIQKPYGDEPSYILRGEWEEDPEHGLSIVIRGDYVIQICQWRDYDNPWGYKLEQVYSKMIANEGIDFKSIDSIEKAKELADKGVLSRTQLISTTFGGSEGLDNTLFVTKQAAEYMERINVLLEMLLTSGIHVTNYLCRPTYEENSVVPSKIVVSAENTEDRRILYEIIYVY